MLPWIIGVVAVGVWHVRTSLPQTRITANNASVSGFPQPFDAKKWDDLTAQNPSVRDALVFWANVDRLEPAFLLPTWIELTGAEQKMVVDGFATGDDGRLIQVVQLATRRAEPRSDDAVMRHTPSELVEGAKRG